MSSTVQDMKGNILLCDDLSDTGVTLNKSIQWLKNYPPLKDNIKNIKTAVLWKKKTLLLNQIFVLKNWKAILGLFNLLSVMKK